MDDLLPRRVWQVAEPVHAVVYFAAEVRDATAEAGVPPGWMSYFGCRACPLGAVSGPAATAIFFNLAPAMVGAALPAVWDYASPARLLAARAEAMDAALRRLLGEVVDSPDLARAADLAVRAAAAADGAGRPLAAANAAQPVSRTPHVALWQALTTLREHRGEGHIALLLAAGVGPCEADILLSATGRAAESNLRSTHKWSPEQWAEAMAALVERGWMADDGWLTASGAEHRGQIETDTDRLASGPYRHLGAADSEELIGLLLPMAERVMGSGAVPTPNPAGLTWPPPLAPAHA